MLELLLNPRRKARRARRSRKHNPKAPFRMGLVRTHAIPAHKQKRAIKPSILAGKWINPMPKLKATMGTMTTTVLPMTAGVFGNILLRPRIQSALGLDNTSVVKNAAVGIGSAVLLGVGTGFVAKKYAGKVLIGALIQTAITTALEAKAAHTAATAPAAAPVAPAAAPVKKAGLGWGDNDGLSGFGYGDDDGLSGYSPEQDEEPI
jgi:hypothetical protein